MGFATLGMFLLWHIAAETGAGLGMTGAMVQMVSHGLISGALFLCVGVLYDRVHSRQIADYGGVANTMPVFATFMMLFSMANAGLPGTSGFVGEFMVIIASFKANFWYAFLAASTLVLGFLAASTLVLGAAYTLWMVKRVVYGDVANEQVAKLQDLNSREFIVLAVLAISVLLVGLWPAPLVDMMNVSIEQLIQQAGQPKL
jgi:NADH-quinone oxidoreductase subunit M